MSCQIQEITVARRYRSYYPSPPLLDSAVFGGQPAAALMTIYHFQAEGSKMPGRVYGEHHVLLNLKDDPMRVRNIRDGRKVDVAIQRFDIFITPAGVQNGWEWYETSDVIVVTLDPGAIGRFAERELGLFLSEKQLQDTLHKQDRDLCDAACMVCKTLETNDMASAVMFEALARVFLVKLLTRYGDASERNVQSVSGFSTLHYRRVLDHIKSNLRNSIVLADLAEAAGMSTSNFSKKFKDTLGRSPMQFVQSYRVEQAAAMLTDRSIQLIDISSSCGFSDQAHFSRSFKKYTGISPTDYRARFTS